MLLQPRKGLKNTVIQINIYLFINPHCFQELARRLRSEIYHLTGKAPHLVICHLHRSKLDANREINQATFGNPIAKRAYNDFHGFIRKARKAVKGAAILFDIHGQRHKYGWIDLGYVISGRIAV